MKKMLFGGIVAVVFIVVIADELRLHRVIQKQNVALERLTAEVGDLQRASAAREKQLSAARSVVLAPNTLNGTTNGAATIYGVLPRHVTPPDAIPFASPFLQQQPSEVPPNWEPFEFNGRTYYRIPLASASPEPLGFRH